MLRRRTVTVALSALMLVGGIAIIVAALAGVGARDKARTIPGPDAQGDFAVLEPTPLPPTPAPQPTPEPSRAPIVRLQIPRIGVDAPIVVLGVDAQGVMQDPKGPEEVAWYDFSAHPGWEGNAVFAGHVDYRNYGPAVFWKLRQLNLGDEIKVVLADGTTYSYRVVSSTQYVADQAPVQEIVGPTERQSVTLITCGGTFNTRTREYDQRLVVRAERVLESSVRTQ
ncbi:MAG TPA: class F sortase [Dehalococcoidia bacterium]|nr:class F sortase [Dehalococcoidia bacterium]